MLIDLVPDDLKAPFSQFLQQLKTLEKQTMTQCPYCHSERFSQTRAMPLTFRCKQCHKYFNPLTDTPFNKLQPISLVAQIFVQRVERHSYQTIADHLDLTLRQIYRRERAIKLAMQHDFPELLTWYSLNDKQSTASELILQQQQSCINNIRDLLNSKPVNCPYCKSEETVKIGHRTTFRCKHCSKTFNLLSGTVLNKLPHANKWVKFINLLVAHQTDTDIASTLQLNAKTVSQWRRRWCIMMQQWGFVALSVWCKKR